MASVIESRRYRVPYVKLMFATIFFIATIANFYHFHKYYENFSSDTLNDIVGERFIEENKLWIFIPVEHFVLGLFILVNLFNYNKLSLSRRRQTGAEKEYLERYKR